VAQASSVLLIKMLFPPQSKVKMNRKRQKRKIVIMLIPVALQSIGAVLQFMVYDTTSTRKLWTAVKIHLNSFQGNIVFCSLV